MWSSRPEVVDVTATRATTARIVELCDQLQSLQAELTAERLTCSAATSTVTRQGRSILDVTRATATITVGQRRVLLVREPTFRFPECAVIAARCDTHHLRHRSDGGERGSNEPASHHPEPS